MSSTKTKKQVIDDILSESKGGYGKLLSPFRFTFNYTTEDLSSFLLTAIDLCGDIKKQLQELMKRKSILNLKYSEKSRLTLGSIESTILKLQILKSKVLRSHAKCQDQDSSDYCNDVACDFSQQKVVEIDMLTHEDNNVKSDSTEDSLKINDDVALEELKSHNQVSEYTIDSYSPSFDKLLISEILNPEGLGENNLKVGINPTALSTEVLIKVLIKMEEALTRLLINTNNYDYCEFFYRADFLHVYESSIHEIIKMPDDDVFYYS